MPRKKIVFVIVEGPSDSEALELLLSKIFYNDNVFVHITYGDITTHKDTTHVNILSKIGNLINSYIKSNHFNKTLFREIIHILDTDGAYIPDSSVVFEPSAKHILYTSTEIITDKKEAITLRNKKKSQCLDKISSVNSIGGIPYHAFYMSCNLDHVLYDLMNPTDEEKEINSIAFARKYEHNIDGFIQYISASAFSVQGDYFHTWKYIKEELHSLERHTNLGLCFNPSQY